MGDSSPSSSSSSAFSPPSSSWLTFAGTALSGLGATINGLHSLYDVSVPHWHSLDWEALMHTVAASAVGGAAALGGGAAAGWLAKFGSGSAGLSLSSLTLGAGCVYAAVGFLVLLRSIVRLSTDRPPRHAPVEGTAEALEYPAPDWLSTRVLNWGVMGRVGAGKSTLINALRGLKARDPDAAPVGVGHTTRRPRPYTFTGDVAVLTRNMARLWDLPGAGTKEWPCSSYVRVAGLRHFDGVIFVTSGAFSESEADLIKQLLGFQVPYYLVRNKVDQDAVNNEEDHGTNVQETLAEIRTELLENGCDPARTFLVSARYPECADYEFGLLLRAMAADVSAMRMELPEFQDEAPWSPSARRQLQSAAGSEASGATLPVQSSITAAALPSPPAGAVPPKLGGCLGRVRHGRPSATAAPAPEASSGTAEVRLPPQFRGV